MTVPSVQMFTAKIEALYDRPIAELEVCATSSPHSSMLAALIATRDELHLAETNITQQLQRLRDLSAPAQRLELSDAAHLADCVRRLTDSIVARDAGVRALTRVLQSLHRAPKAEPVAFSPPPERNTAPGSRLR